MSDPSAQRTEAVARFLLAHAVRQDDGGRFHLAFPDRHSSLIEARFSNCTAEELGRGEDLAMVQILWHLMMRERSGAWPPPDAWADASGAA
ncbi:hypothetical protein MKK69_19480 [Methylobacterium sp. J-026]|uniref:hypothetical protein n=1 Tax=Methylobacterium sp. J-026 TaxID=2836624 RepID=UPI001FBAAA2C|nr:hypothetical protein [Methylobacterium sp. J-026]MCJ2136206.1 hypothetical protein [Methylobacterium sp. J-026]